MIKANSEYGLEGAFKADFYDANGNFVDSTNYFSNFITYSGLIYPTVYHFPECFKFLSLGSSNSANTISTTGLLGSAVSLKSKDAFSNLNFATQTLQFLGPSYYSKGNCGFTVSKDGPVYFRAWKIPSGENAVAAENITIKEFVVSPSSGTDTSGNAAFSRVAKEIILQSGNSAILTYRLKLKILSTGINYLTGFDVSKADLEDGNLVTDWANATGIYRQVYHGLAAIDINGNSFIPKYGDIMEPASVNQKNFTAYFSPDYGQFDTNTITGIQPSVSNSYKADGLLNVSFNHDFSESIAGESPEEYAFIKTELLDFPEDDKNYAKNIHYDGDFPKYNDFTGSLQKATFKSTSFNYSNLSLATPGILGFDPDALDYRNKASFCAGVFTESFNPTGVLQQNRKKTISRKILFTPNKSYGTNTRYGSFVYGYKNGNDIWPAIDCIFYNSSGQLLMAHYRNLTGFYNFEVGTGIGTGQAALSPALNGYFNYNLLVDSNGSVTGFVKTNNYLSGIFDRFLQKHSLGDISEPDFTGVVLNPSGYPHFNNTDKINLIYNNLQFFASGLGYIPTGYFEFSPSKQILHEVSFSGDANTNLRKIPLRLSESRITGEQNSLSGGFFLSRHKFIDSGKENSLDHSSLIGAFDGIVSDQYLTGYFYSGDTLLTSFNVFAQEETLNLDESTQIQVLRLNRLVNNSDSTGSAISSLTQRGSGLITLPNPSYRLTFSGEPLATTTGVGISGWSSIACSNNATTVIIASHDNNSYPLYSLSGGKENTWLELTDFSGNWVALAKSNNDALFHGITEKNYHRLIVDTEKIPVECSDYQVSYEKNGYSISGSSNGSIRTFTISNFGLINDSLFIRTGDFLLFDQPAIEDYSVTGLQIADGGSDYQVGEFLYAIGGKRPDGTAYDNTDEYAIKIEVKSVGVGNNGDVTSFNILHYGSYLSGDYFKESSPFTWKSNNSNGTGFAANPIDFTINKIRGGYSVKSIDKENKNFTITGSGFANYKTLNQTSILAFPITGNSGKFIDIDAYDKIFLITRAGLSNEIERNFIFRSDDSGINWSGLYFDDESDKFKKIACSNNGGIVCATRSFDHLLISKNTGENWEDSSCAFNWTSIDINNNGSHIVALAKSDLINPGDYIYTSHDSGNNWYLKKQGGIKNWKEVVISDNGRRIIASPETGHIYRTFNSGKIWSPTEIQTGWTSIAMSSDGTISFALVSGGYVYSPLRANEQLSISFLENTGNYTWIGTSNLSGIPVYTQFCEPSGILTHMEAGKVLPNNYFLGNTGELLSITGGGVYPGLSDKNNLEIKIDMSWSSPCAGVIGCTEPS